MKKIVLFLVAAVMLAAAVCAGAETVNPLNQLNGQIFTFSSGAGGWCTDLYFTENGSFTGDYHDSEMGETGEGYPEGTLYGCVFHGQLSDPVTVDEFTLTAAIAVEANEGQVPEVIADGVRYVTTEPFGVAKAKTVTIYLPGTPVDRLPEAFLPWAHLQEIAPDAKVLPCYAIWSEADEAGFIAYPEDDEIGYYPDEHPESKVYLSTWVAEDGNWRIEMNGEDGGIRPAVYHRLGDNKEDIWEYAAALGKNGELAAVPFGLHYRQDTVSGNWDITYYEDGDATFTVNENGKLIWNDLKEDAGKGLEFEKIGDFYGTRWMKGDIEVIFYDWYQGQYDIRLYQRGTNNEILKDAILKGDYDAVAGTVTAEGEFEGEDPIKVTFSYNDQNDMVWTENGKSTVMEYSFLVD
jgi:hypothetical protein